MREIELDAAERERPQAGSTRIPYLSAASVVVVAFFGAALLPRATWPLIDPDVWWHIRAGDEVLATGRVPATDSWSLTAAGHPWISQDWMTNVVLALGARAGGIGEMFLSLVFAALAFAGFVVLWRAIAIRERSVGWLSRVGWLSAGLLLAGPTLGVRVQVVDLPLTALVLWILWRYLAERRPRVLVGLPIIAVTWVNMHAGWPLLFLLGGAMVAGEAIDRGLRPARMPSAMSWRELAALVGALVASAAVLAINPSGLEIYRYPVNTLALTTLKAVGEWQPARLDSLFGQLLAGFVIVGVLPAIVFAWRRMLTAELLILVGLTVMAALAVRFLLILGPVGAAIIAVSLGPVISGSRLGNRAAPLLQQFSRPRRDALLAVLLVALLALGSGLALARSLPATQEAEISRAQPVAAVAWIVDSDPGEQVFNRYEWGGYLGLHRPERPIFIDGRADVYGDEVIAEYVQTIGLSIDPQKTFDRYQIDYVLFDPGTPLAGWLDHSSNWKRVYADAVAAVWVRAA
jgi:hypothetical protein